MFVERRWREPTPEEWWGQEGRFNKLTLSCDCAICMIMRWGNKYRNTHRRAEKKRARDTLLSLEAS